MICSLCCLFLHGKRQHRQDATVMISCERSSLTCEIAFCKPQKVFFFQIFSTVFFIICLVPVSVSIYYNILPFAFVSWTRTHWKMGKIIVLPCTTFMFTWVQARETIVCAKRFSICVRESSSFYRWFVIQK